MIVIKDLKLLQFITVRGETQRVAYEYEGSTALERQDVTQTPGNVDNSNWSTIGKAL